MNVPMAEIGVEAFMTNPPQPTNYLVKQDGCVVAMLTHAQVERAYQQFTAMQAQFDKQRAILMRNTS